MDCTCTCTYGCTVHTVPVSTLKWSWRDVVYTAHRKFNRKKLSLMDFQTQLMDLVNFLDRGWSIKLQPSCSVNLPDRKVSWAVCTGLKMVKLPISSVNFTEKVQSEQGWRCRSFIYQEFKAKIEVVRLAIVLFFRKPYCELMFGWLVIMAVSRTLTWVTYDGSHFRHCVQSLSNSHHGKNSVVSSKNTIISHC